MCMKGDIILVENPKYKEKEIGKHPFVVLSDCNGIIQGMKFDFISLVISSFKSEEHREKKLSYDSNYHIKARDKIIDSGVVKGINKDGFVKCEQFYYFDKENISFMRIGRLVDGVFENIIEHIEKEMKTEIINVTDNLVTPEKEILEERERKKSLDEEMEF